MPNRPEDIDEGSPYATDNTRFSDTQGATRVQAPQNLRPGPGMRFIDKEEVGRIGTTGRAALNVDRPVQLTQLDFDPRVSCPIGVKPVSFDHDPRNEIGSSGTTIIPEYVILSKLKSQGADENMLLWAQAKGQMGQHIGMPILKQLEALAKYGDMVARGMLSYILVSVHPAIDRNLRARQSQQVARAAGMGFRPSR